MLKGCCVLLILLISLPAPRCEPAPERPKPVTLVFEDAPVQQVLRALAEHQRLNLMIAPGIEGVISLNLRNVPWQQALDLVVRTGGLRLERRGNVLLVSPGGESPAGRRAGDDNRTVVADLPLSNRLVTLVHADAGEVAKNIGALRKFLLSPRGSMSLDKRTNSLILRDTETALSALSDWIAIWDVPLEQVMITAHIVTISRDNLREIGVDWHHRSGAPSGLTKLGVELPLDDRYASIGFRLARLSGRLLELELAAMEQENKVDILASPRLYATHMQTASIKQGTEIPYQVAGGKYKASAIQFKEAVLSMEVKPKVMRDGRLTLDLRLSQNVPGRVIKQGGNESVSIDMEEIKTQVTLRDGETVVLGGIFQRHNHQSQERVPLLGEIPLLGNLFKRQRAHYKQRELVIFITPTQITR